jgi:type II secretory pathway pseudopilin PulG
MTPRGKQAEATGRPEPAGFTLIEVLIAMGILMGALMVIMGVFFQNLRFARMAREEIIVSMIQRDVQARNHVMSSARAGKDRAFWRGVSGESPPSFEEFGSPRDGSSYGTGPGETVNPDDVLNVGWGIRNIAAWEKISNLHWGISDPRQDKDVPLYEGFYFTAHPVWRYPDGTDADGDGIPDYPWRRRTFEPGNANEWDPATTSGFKGLALEDSQFTDWDGYGMVDMDGDGEAETDRGLPWPSPGPIHRFVPAGFPGGSETYDDNPYRIFFNSDKLRNYMLRVRVRIMWNVKSEEHIYKTDEWVKGQEDAGTRIFSHNEYYFSVFNADLVKRWQAPGQERP